MQSPRRKPRRWLTGNEKGKKNMSEYGTDKDELDRSESDSKKNEEGPSETKSVSAKRASKSANGPRSDGCKECVPTRRVGGTSVHGTTRRISDRNEHFGNTFSARNAYSGMSAALRTGGCYIGPVLSNN